MKRLLSAALVLACAPLWAHASGPVASSTPKVVALTFDDGPYGTSTEQVLGILSREGVHATFFLVGERVSEYPALAREEVAEGNTVGNHTWDHPKHLPQLSPAEFDAELSRTEAVIASTTGVTTRLFRPPYGNLTKALRKRIEAKGYTVVLWNVDPKDWDNASSTSAAIVAHIRSHLKPRMVIVLHDGRDTHENYPRDNMLAALPTVIEDLKARGYEFVTL